jgi:YVTN family beta-propeller protein
MNFGQARVRLVQAGAVFSAAALVAGCGNNYRPVVTPVNPSGPAAQPQSYAVVVSAPSSTTNGIATIVDYSGDTKMAEAPILGVGPTTFAMDALGVTGFALNSDGTLTTFPVSSSLKEKQEVYTTLPSMAEPLNLFSSTGVLWAADLDGNMADAFSGSPYTFLRSVPLPPTPVAIVGTGLRNFAISQGNSQGGNVSSGVACNISPSTVGVNGEADGIEVASYTVSSQIPLGQCPVYAIMSTDARRVFVLNRGSDTISVINTQTDMLDTCSGLVSQSGQKVTCHPTLPLSLTAVNALNAVTPGSGNPPNGTAGMTATAGPVYAEYNAATNQLIVANYDGGTISVIDVTLDEYGNDYNTYDSNGNITGGFGTTYTIPVGNNPASVTVLYDGSRAYTANQTDQTVTIVNLSSHSVEKTLPVIGNPRTVASTQNSSYGKVYVASPNSPYLTIIRTDQDIVDATVLVEGNVVDVRTSTQNGTSGNSNNVSRTPGYGQPCNLPLSDFAPATNISLTLSRCQAQDVTKLK